MNGFINHRHVLTQAPELLKDFGIKVYIHCLIAVVFYKNKTFLQILTECHCFESKNKE